MEINEYDFLTEKIRRNYCTCDLCNCHGLTNCTPKRSVIKVRHAIMAPLNQILRVRVFARATPFVVRSACDSFH